MSDQLNIKLNVYSPFNDYYNGPALSLSAVNATGPFDILPKHHNFISLLEPCDLIVRSPDQAVQRIRISGGLIHVKANDVTVFLDV
jgi:F0F1-type ATP synthase epsilon subunit